MHATAPGKPGRAPAEVPFYIPAVNLPARPLRTLKHDDVFVVFDSHGDIGASSGANDGLFHCDTRLLSHLELLVQGSRPLLLGSAVKDDNLSYYVDLTNPDIYADQRIVLLRDTVHIGRTMYLYGGSLRERIVLTNHGAETVKLDLSLTFASDFADIFEVRGIRRARRGRAWCEILSEDAVALCYSGLDDVERRTALRFEPAPDVLLDNVAKYQIGLDPGETSTLFVTASSGDHSQQATRSFFKGIVDLQRKARQRGRDIALVETSNPVINQVLGRSLADLYMLISATPEGPYPYAGIPWYSTTFGRDGVITALQMLWFDPSIAAGVLRRLARYQALSDDDASDAQTGKLLHEMRGGEMAALREIPFGLYYGSVDSTPLFVVLAGCYARRTGDLDLIRELWPHIERALAWIDGPGDRDGDGFIEYERGASTGLANQGWKDSFDSVFHADGRLAEGPIALAEVQGYVYAAKLEAAFCARSLGLAERAVALEEEARRLQQRFDEVFWCERIGTYALALDGKKAPCEVRTSNAGQVLFSRIARPERAVRVAAQLMHKDFYSGWGIRTVAEGEPRYNPMSYHNGSVWPHDNALIASGLATYGHMHAVGILFEALLRAATAMDHRRLPELFCGFRRRRGRGPILYPAACSPQAWAAGTPFLLLETLLGLEFDPAARHIRLHSPTLPGTIGEIIVRNLRLGAGVADFALRRSQGTLSLEVLRSAGGVAVTLEARSGHS